MAWTSPRTWADGDILTATLFKELVTNINYLKGKEGNIALEGNITFTSTQTVDGVDLSAHKAGTVMSQHDGDMGDHNHETTGAEGGNLSADAITSSQISISRMPRDSSTKKRLTAQGAGVDPAWVDF